MQKFRSLKNKLINSKRDSQKLNEQQICSFLNEHSLSHINSSLTAKLRADIHLITDNNYKIMKMRTHNDVRMDSQLLSKTIQVDGLSKLSAIEEINSRSSQKNMGKVTMAMRKVKEMEGFVNADSKETIRKRECFDKCGQDDDKFGKILGLMQRLNQLQQKKGCYVNDDPSLKSEIRESLAAVKQLIKTIQDESQRNLLDFYNEQQSAHSKSCDSFHSQSSDQTYQLNSQRQAYEMSDKKQAELEQQFQIKYRRISIKSTAEDENQDESGTPMNNTFEDEEEDEDFPNQQSQQKNIIHLFSYDNERYLNSPLSRISQRESEYNSPQSKTFQSNTEILGQSLQYKKILYLLQTTQKKRVDQPIRQQKQTSELKLLDSNSNRSMYRSIKNEDKERYRCHGQLQEMINLLEGKYRRNIRNRQENFGKNGNQNGCQKNIRKYQVR